MFCISAAGAPSPAQFTGAAHSVFSGFGLLQVTLAADLDREMAQRCKDCRINYRWQTTGVCYPRGR